ncbi:MAG TPA: Stp1/IreP family PP2C-type Ser/Thr phosphatase [Bacillales bacterium]|nr:Stp1/IreP family PP2C-type Ser/Thr phosphatase [Bacillales bacterium]
METAFITDCGKIRMHNEDSGGIFPNEKGLILAVVADGMGGHRAGDVASSLALDYIKKQWAQVGELDSGEAAGQWLRETINDTNTYILAYAQEHPECRGMGTTIVSALCSNKFVTVAHVGDSRGYMLKDKRLTQVTKDHSLVSELVRRGEISEEEADLHPRKHVLLQALGTEETVESEVETLLWESGNVVLLCSDGLTNNVSHEKLEEVLGSEQPVQEKAEKLTEFANMAGGDDNITLTLVQLPQEGKVVSDMGDQENVIKTRKLDSEETLSTEERNG